MGLLRSQSQAGFSQASETWGIYAFLFFLCYFIWFSIPTRHKVLMRDSEEMQKEQQSCKDLAVINFTGFKVKRDLETCLAPFHIPRGTKGWSVMSASSCLERGLFVPWAGGYLNRLQVHVSRALNCCKNLSSELSISTKKTSLSQSGLYPECLLAHGSA